MSLENKLATFVSVDILDILRVLALFFVFMLHVTLFDGADYAVAQIFKDYPYLFFLKTPAWAGTWIFYCLSGYFVGYGYLTKKYDFATWTGIFRFYKVKFGKIYVPSLVVVLFVSLALNPNFFSSYEAIVFLRRLVFCTYYAKPDPAAIGAVWFVSTLMWLYVFSPLFVRCLDKTISHVSLYKIFLCVLLSGLFTRILMCVLNIEWSRFVYSSVLGNTDLFIAGIISSFIVVKMDISRLGIYRTIVSWGFVIFILINICVQWKFAVLYQYVFPTIYVGFVTLLIATYNDINFIGRGNKNIIFVISKIKQYGFYFYLFHSPVALVLCKYIGGETSLEQYFKCVICVGIITFLLAKFFVLLEKFLRNRILCKSIWH